MAQYEVEYASILEVINYGTIEAESHDEAIELAKDLDNIKIYQQEFVRTLEVTDTIVEEEY